MARSRTPSKKKKAAASAGPLDLGDANINLAVTVGAVAVLGMVGSTAHFGDGFSYENMSSGFESGYLTKVFSVFDGSEDALHATYWTASLATTLHIMNNVGGRSGHMAGQLVASTFACFGGLIMQSFLAGNGMADIWSMMPVMFACWYLVNNNIPKTGINVWNMISDNVSTFIPLQRIMDLCTLTYNAKLLISVAEGFAGTASFGGDTGLPNLAKAMASCVAIHCATDFLNQDGFNFNISSCSDAMERAILVCFWCATNGLSTVTGGAADAAVGPLVNLVGGDTAGFLMTCIILNELLGDMIEFKGISMIFDALNDNLLD